MYWNKTNEDIDRKKLQFMSGGENYTTGKCECIPRIG